MQSYVTIHCEIQSLIHIVDHHVYHERTEHINVRLYFVKDVVEYGEVKILKVVAKDTFVNVFMKSPPILRFKYCLEQIIFLFKDKEMSSDVKFEKCDVLTLNHNRFIKLKKAIIYFKVSCDVKFS